MAKYILSAFADEVSPVLKEQLEYLNKQDIGFVEPRNVDGINVSSLSLQQAKDAKKLMDKYGVGVSSIGSPIGKVNVVTDDLDEHFKLFEHTLDIADVFETRNIRMFSFYYPQGHDCHEYKDAVLSNLEKMVEKAQKRKINLCHENEHNIYGENPDDCADLMKYFGGALKSVFDNGNFAFTNYNALDAYDKLNDYIEYFHIKDAYMGSEIVPAGMGDGKIYEVLSEYNKITNRDVFLTLEPHLTVFGGLDKLANVSELKMGVQFESAEKAFDAATEALRNILKKI